MVAGTGEGKARVTPELLLTIVLVTAYVVWMLSLPAWPSQDGPVHLYYVHVIGRLLAHQPTVYSHFYTIKHFLPPYALYYYALLVLSHFCSLLLADRIVLCVYFVLFVFGFRFVAKTIGAAYDRATLLVVLLTLNWSAGMGFLNYCLSLAITLWAIGFWLRFKGRDFGSRIIFLLLVTALTLTHPVPLLILLAFCGADLLQRFFNRRRAVPDGPAPLRADLVLLCISSLALLYVHHFATPQPASAHAQSAAFILSAARQHAVDMLRMHHLALIFGHDPATRFYLASILATLALAYVLAVTQWMQNRKAARPDPSSFWLVLSIVLLLLVPILPSDLNDAFYFSERLTILVWLAPLLATSAYAARGPLRYGVLLFALLANGCLLWKGDHILRGIATETTAVQTAPEIHAGQLGLLLEDPSHPPALTQGPLWNPFYWAGAHVFRHEDAVLDNSPWLDAAIIPLGAEPALPLSHDSSGNDASPHRLSVLMQASASGQARVLQSVEFVMITGPNPSPGAASLLLGAGAAGWQCQRGAAWYQVCSPAH